MYILTCAYIYIYIERYTYIVVLVIIICIINSTANTLTCVALLSNVGLLYTFNKTIPLLRRA